MQSTLKMDKIIDATLKIDAIFYSKASKNR